MDYNLIISVAACIIAVLALIVGFYAVRFQYIAIINTQLADRARMCNEQLTDTNKSYVPKENDKISGILSGIITAEEIMNSYLSERNPFLLNLNSQRIIDHFYLQLHTTIRIFIERKELFSSDISNPNLLIEFNQQLKRVQIFLGGAITKNKNLEFERLHELSVKSKR
jgi:type III secretory pathway component EscV